MISISFLLTGFGLGFAGSLHCVGMCGPLALALPLKAFSGAKQVVAMMAYHFGRVISYSLLGLITGFIGRQFFLAGYQQLFSIIIGTALVLWLFFAFNNKFISRRSRVYHKVQAWIIHYMQQPSIKNMLLTGIGNGLLPCGMVYLAIAAAAASGNILSGAGFMLFFGLGTIPLMGMVTVAGLRIGPKARNSLRKVSPYLTAFIGVLLILRGLNLNIPYISPLLSAVSGTAISCHE
jgi:sulfite exporter TauE/SafE